MADAFDLLKQDHRKVEQLFDQFEGSGDRDVAVQICDELTVHAIIEEEMIYPLLRANVAPGMADEARDEHEEAKAIIARIYALESSDDALRAAVQELKQVIEHHVTEEETEVFPKMEEDIPDTVGLLGNELQKRKGQLQANKRTQGSVGDKPSTAPRAN